MNFRPYFITAFLFLALNSAAIAAPVLDLQYEGFQPLPAFQIDGKPARIHTQGLLVTEKHFYVTGRLESSPRRAMLVRFERTDPSQVDYLDITPKTADGQDRLDHPGGFDFDGKDLWIPISASKPTSITAIVRVSARPDHPLSKQIPKTVFQVNDHIGALAYDRESKILTGANWDTKVIYQWHPFGHQLQIIPRRELIKEDPHWALAVQDWKYLGENRLLASGIDKRPGRDRRQSAAVVELLDVSRRTRLAQVKLPSPTRYRGNLTREGMSAWEQQLFFLPADLGDNAEIYRYRWRRPFPEK